MAMKTETRRLALGAVLAAAETALIYLSGVVPSGRLALAVLAGLLNALAVLEAGRRTAWLTFAATGALSLLLCPLKGPPLCYLVLFGHYPIVKSLLERIRSRWLCLAAKLGVYVLAAAALLALYSRALLSGVALPAWSLYLLAAAGGAAFLVYDLVMSGLIQTYLNRKMKL